MIEHMVGLLSRRRFLLGAGAMAVAPGAALAKGEHPSIVYMRKVAKDMLAAHRLGTVSAFMSAIQRHAAVSDIALYSLGNYSGKLGASQRQRYFKGVATFMSRYFADQTRTYKVAKYELGEATVDDDKTILIPSKVYLMTGSTYTVVWRLEWKEGSYKVTDAKVLGFSLVYLQRGIFVSYLSKRQGDVAALVTALNR